MIIDGARVFDLDLDRSHTDLFAAHAGELLHWTKTTNLTTITDPYEVAIKLGERLCRVTPGNSPKKAVFVSSGAEAVENAVKIARYYTGRPAILVFDNAYHGRTLLTMTMTSKVKPYKWKFGPFAPEVYRMPFGDKVGADKLKDVFIKQIDPESLAAVVVDSPIGDAVSTLPLVGTVFSHGNVRILALSFTLLLYFTLYWAAPNRKVSVGQATFAAILATILSSLGTIVYAWAIGLPDWGIVYGSLARIIATLFWLYWLCVILLAAAETSQVIHEWRRIRYNVRHLRRCGDWVETVAE